MNITKLIRLSGAAILAVFPAVVSHAQNPEAPNPVVEISEADFTLNTLVVTPTKFPLKQTEVGSAITIIPASDLEARQIRSFEDALKFAPGVTFATSGQTGSNSSIFLRGVNSNQTQFLVDGVRINDSNILPQPFTGGAAAHSLSSIEVLRGPQSALYGGEAIGGVISMTTPRGSGTPTSQIEGMTGSFGTFGTQFSSSGELGTTAYSLSLGYDETENDRPNNDFENFYYAGRIDQPLSEATTFGFTFRGAEREFGSPGSIFEQDPDNLDRDSFLLLTSYLDHQFNDRLNTRFIAGYLDQQLDFEFPPGGSSTIENDKVILDWRNTLAWEGGHTSLLGVGFENTNVSNTGFGSIDETEQLFSLYFQQLLQVTEALSVTGGVRWEDYDSFGDTVNYRGAAAYHVEQTGTTFRTSVGSGFRAPSFFELFATSPFFVENPDLAPEESVGWDVGVEQQLGELGIFSVTWFDNQLDDLIATSFTSAVSSVENLEEASTSGLEVAWAGRLLNQINYQLAYTYLEATNDTSGLRLLRRPTHTLGFDVNTNLCEKLTVGMGGYWLNDRLDIDPVSFATIAGDDYFVARFYTNLAVNDDLDVFFRVENAFDEDYEEIAGFPGRGLGVFGGAKLRF